MTAQLANASVLYLDDQPGPLRDAKGYFEEKGFDIQITQSIEEAKQKAIRDLDVFVCDLRLDNISDTEKGNQILRYIRSQNANVFLALYTAYERDLSLAERKNLEANNIKIYGKEDNDEFLANLQQDYEDFMNEKEKTGSRPTPPRIEEEVKLLVLKHLHNVSNPDVVIPIPDHSDIKVKDLIIEVTNDSLIGRQYMSEWLATMALIKEIRKQK